MSATKYISELTPEQKSRFQEFIDKWKTFGLCTAPADRERAEEGVREVYAAAKLPAPRVVWCSSPMAAIITRAIILEAIKSPQPGASVWASVGASVRDSVRDSVWASVGASVGASVWASVGASVRASVGDSVGDSVWASVRASVWDGVGASVRDGVYSAGYGQHDANWIGFYDYFREVCGLEKLTEPLQGLAKITESASWFWPHENICWMSDRPYIVKQDDRNRLHNESGPAYAHRDDWSLYYIHGVRVPELVVMNPELITVKMIEDEKNAEIRRIMVDRYGQDRYRQDCGAVVLHQDDFGVLKRKELEGDEPIVFVEVINSTQEPDGTFKNYSLRVHPELRPLLPEKKLGRPQKLTARNAIASTFGLTGEEYELAQQS